MREASKGDGGVKLAENDVPTRWKVSTGKETDKKVEKNYFLFINPSKE